MYYSHFPWLLLLLTVLFFKPVYKFKMVIQGFDNSIQASDGAKKACALFNHMEELSTELLGVTGVAWMCIERNSDLLAIIVGVVDDKAKKKIESRWSDVIVVVTEEDLVHSIENCMSQTMLHLVQFSFSTGFRLCTNDVLI